jgi:hypothetical protein
MQSRDISYDFYLEDDGTVGVATLEGGSVTFRRLEALPEGEAKEALLSLPTASLDRYHRPAKLPWLLPKRPEDGEIREADLWTETVRFVHAHVDVDPPFEAAIASFLLATQIPERLPCAPRLILTGDTRSGKSRVLDVCRLLGRKALKFVLPSPASYFRIMDRHGPLLVLVDEFQDLPKEARPQILSLLRAGFGKGDFVPRMNEGLDTEFFRVFGPAAVASRKPLPSDILNRSVAVTMVESERPDLRRQLDESWADDLRTRLFTFRLDVLSGRRSLPLEEAVEKALAPVLVGTNPGVRRISLRSREIDVATALLAPTLPFADDDDVLLAVAGSQQRSQAEIGEGLEARTFYALQVVVQDVQRESTFGLPDLTRGAIFVSDVTDQLNRDLDPPKPISPKRVGKIFRDSFGFTTKRGAGGRAAIYDDEFRDKYDRLLAKYGPRIEEGPQ